MEDFNTQYLFLEKPLQDEILKIGIYKTFQPNEVLFVFLFHFHDKTPFIVDSFDYF